MISRRTIDKIIDAARIEEVVGDFVHLKRAGANLKGLCPFHDEKTPSFVVSPAKNIFKCFGCGQAGDSVKFVMEHEGVNYPEALRYLAERYRIEIEEDESDQDREEQLARRSLKDSVFIAMKFAAQFYRENLLETDEGKSIGLSYFKHRGFSQKTIDTFHLGYAPEGFDNFITAALKAGYNQDVLEAAGLIKIKEGRNPYDFFRARVMFPIHNLSGKVVAFGGRIMAKDTKQAKYINTPETPVYTKGHLLYGIYQAKESIRKQDACYLVEGYTDVLGLHQAGIENIVASSGTALTKEQVKLISRFTKNIILIYDGDKAGINAALRGVDIMLELDMNVDVVLLPEGEDPDSFVREKGTDETLKYIQENKKDFIFFKSDVLLKDSGNDPTQRAQAVRGIIETVARINDPIRRAYYVRACSKLAELEEDILITEINKYLIQLHRQNERERTRTTVSQRDADIVPARTHDRQTDKEENQKKSIHAQEKDILRVLLVHGSRIMKTQAQERAVDYILNQIKGVSFEHPLYEKILNTIVRALEDKKSIEEVQDENFYEDEEIKNFIIGIKISPYELSPNWETQNNILVKGVEKTWERDVQSSVNRYILQKIKARQIEIDQQIKALSPDDVEKCTELLEQKLILQNPKIDIAEKFGTIIF